jgi:hypothetical protein
MGEVIRVVSQNAGNSKRDLRLHFEAEVIHAPHDSIFVIQEAASVSSVERVKESLNRIANHNFDHIPFASRKLSILIPERE